MTRNMPTLKTALLLVGLFLVSMVNAQTFQETGKLEWIVKDRDYSRRFLGAYIDTLVRMDPTAELEIQETDELRVIVSVDVEGNPSLQTLYAMGRSGVLNRLAENVLGLMDSTMVVDVLQRRYAWDYLSEVDVGGGRGEVINVFEEVSNKQVRDAFWWTHRRVDISAFPRIFLRVNPKYAFAVEFGRSDLGYPAPAYRTMNLGMATEILKFYLTLPAGYFNVFPNSIPLEGSFGAVLKFDSPSFGGSISFQDMNFRRDANYADTLNVVYNPYAGQFYYSFTSRVGSAPDEPGFVPLGSLRLQMGFSYMQFEQGWIRTYSNNQFKEESRSDPLYSLFGLFRLEYASEMNDSYFNRIKMAGQLNIGLDGFGGFNLNTTYTLKEWLGFNLDVAYFWKAMVFEGTDRYTDWVAPFDSDDNDEGYPGNRYPDFEWKPGFFLVPSITLYF